MAHGKDHHKQQRAVDPDYDAKRRAAEAERRAQNKLDKVAKAVARTRQEETDKQLLAKVRKETCLRARHRGGFALVAQQNASNSFTAAGRTEALLSARRIARETCRGVWSRPGTGRKQTIPLQRNFAPRVRLLGTRNQPIVPNAHRRHWGLQDCASIQNPFPGLMSVRAPATR